MEYARVHATRSAREGARARRRRARGRRRRAGAVVSRLERRRSARARRADAPLGRRAIVESRGDRPDRALVGGRTAAAGRARSTGSTRASTVARRRARCRVDADDRGVVVDDRPHRGFWARRQAQRDRGAPLGRAARGRRAAADRARRSRSTASTSSSTSSRSGRRRDRVHGAGETIHLHCTDGDGEWLVRLARRRRRSSRASTPRATSRRAAPRRTCCCSSTDASPPERVEVFGDAALLDRWQRARQLVSASRVTRSGATAVRSTSMTCSRRAASASGESGSMSSRPVISGASERYDSTAP